MMRRDKLTLVTRTLLIFFAVAIGTRAQQSPSQPVDKVIVIKHERALQLLSKGAVVKTYKVALGTQAVGPKQQQGDHRTPEGTYILDSRNEHSQFYKSIHISYPDSADKARANAAHVSPGGDIYVHGLPNGFGFIGKHHRLRDWTDGCIAVTDDEIDEIWALVKNGTPIEIKP
jgi:murein L,D-transpeptidase YafK